MLVKVKENADVYNKELIGKIVHAFKYADFTEDEIQMYDGILPCPDGMVYILDNPNEFKSAGNFTLMLNYEYEIIAL